MQQQMPASFCTNTLALPLLPAQISRCPLLNGQIQSDKSLCLWQISETDQMTFHNAL